MESVPLDQGNTRRNSSASGYLKHIEGMRAVAALIVYINHAYAQAFYFGDISYDPGWLSIARYSMIAGHLSVTVFIVISGFCLTLPVVAGGDRLRGGTLGFMKRRARRILPAYYGSLALALVLIATIIGEPTGTLWDVPIHVTPSAVVSHLFLLQDFFGTSRINYVLWSIAVEWQIYFLFPLLVWSWRRFGPGKTASAAMLIGYVLYFSFYSTRIVRSNPHFIGMFTLGMLTAYIVTSPKSGYVRLREKFPWALTSIVGVTLAAVLTVVWGINLATARFAVLDLPVGVMTASLLVLASRAGGTVSRVFSWKPLVMIGHFSYSLYLIHAPLLQIFWQYGLRPANVGERAMFGLLMTVGLALVLLVSYLFYRLFEEPFMRTSASARQRERASISASVGLGLT